MAEPLVVLAGHAGFAAGALDAVEMILGPQDGVHAVGLTPDQDPGEVVSAVAEATDGHPGRVLLLTDLLGGSPGNALAAAFLADERFELLAGVNLPMLLELLTKRGRDGVDLVRAALDAGGAGVVDVGDRLRAARASAAATAPGPDPDPVPGPVSDERA